MFQQIESRRCGDADATARVPAVGLDELHAPRPVTPSIFVPDGCVMRQDCPGYRMEQPPLVTAGG